MFSRKKKPMPKDPENTEIQIKEPELIEFSVETFYEVCSPVLSGGKIFYEVRRGKRVVTKSLKDYTKLALSGIINQHTNHPIIHEYFTSRKLAEEYRDANNSVEHKTVEI